MVPLPPLNAESELLIWLARTAACSAAMLGLTRLDAPPSSESSRLPDSLE